MTAGLEESAKRLAGLVQGSERCVALTGAGISVPSGIPDFRSPGTGLWEKVDPMEVAHIDAFRRDPNRFWSFYSQRFLSLHDKEPNAAHAALADLERRGMLEGVITQNIDRLHERAGSRRVVEVHGSIDSSICLGCGSRQGLEQVLSQLQTGAEAPVCADCTAVLKPEVVLFGELLPEAALADAHSLAAGADLMLCVGSSLEVYPVAALPGLTQSGGGRLAIINQGPTPYDDAAEIRMGGDVVACFEALLSQLDS